MARTRGVSWLRGARLAFPTVRQWHLEPNVCESPLQWRDRAGIAPASVTRIRKVILLFILLFGAEATRDSVERQARPRALA